MPNRKAAWVAAIATPLGSCVSTADVEPVLPAGHNFSYTVANRERVDLTQVFDDGSSTYFQFKKMPAPPVGIRHVAEENSIAYTRDEHFLKIPGVFDRLLVTVANQTAAVINEAAPAPPHSPLASAERGVPTRNEPLSAGIASDSARMSGDRSLPAATLDAAARRSRAVPVGVPESLQTMNPTLRVATLKQEISSLEERVRRLSSEIEDAQRAGQAASLYVRNLGGLPRVVLTFRDNRHDVEVDEGLLAPLGSAARAADRIYLHGHTDAYVATATGTELAIRRVVDVRRLLVSLNVEPERIRLFYRGAGDFVANNSTPDGKALNRRVEIELRKW